jgi:hypothetical protein
MPKSSYILGRTYKNQETIDWLNEYLYNPEMMPLYTSRDGNCSLTDFHLAVKGKEKLLTLFLTEDDEILGNSDKMLFYSKELESSATDNNYEYNPFLIGKLELESI